MQNSLQKILVQKKKKLDAELPKWNKYKNEWIKKVDNLFSLIKDWIGPLENNNYLKLSYSDISISEESLGRYNLRKMEIIFFNNEKVELIPIGLHVIGASGRIDLKMGERKIMIVGSTDSSGWLFAEREGRGKPKTWTFDEDNFNEILTEFAEEF